MELEQIAMIEETEEGLVITGRPDIVEQMEKNLMRGAIKVSWEPNTPAPKEKETSPSESTTTHSHTLPAGTDQVLIQVEGEKVTYQINPEHP